MSMQSIAWQLMSEADYAAFMDSRNLPINPLGVKLALLAQLGPIYRNTSNNEHRRVIGAVRRRLIRS